jgi:hypothetical protein
VDHARDRRLRRDGFVVFPLLDAEQVARARAEFGRLHGWEGHGFHADLNVADPAYRREVRTVLSELLADGLTRAFADHRPLLANFLCKFPGPDSALYLHRDPMYVDERDGDRTYVAWTALQDITGDNGRLQVLPGSHRLDNRLRGSLLVAPWIAHEDVIRPRLETLSVRAGDCVVLDNALVHCSLPNLTDEPRLVAAVAMKPRTAAPLHHRRFDDVSAATYAVDEDFWCDFTPSELEERPLPLPIARVVPAPQRPLSERHLALLLDHRVARALDRALDGAGARVAPGLAAKAGRLHRAAAPVVGPVRHRAAAVRRLVLGARRRLRRAVAATARKTVRRQSIVIVSWAPDDRPGTRCLRDIVHELRRRPGLRVSTWFVRGPSAAGDWRGARVVDLQRWLPVRVLRHIGAPVAARRLHELRTWVLGRRLSSSRADVVVYDDGVGTRFLPSPPGSVRVVRRNGRPPVDAHAELASTPRPLVDLTLVGPGADARSSLRVLDAPFVRDWRELLGPDVDAARARTRRHLGVEDDAVVVVGTGRDGWLDGPELFVRVLWELERSHGIAAHGVWLAPTADHLEVQRLRAEADRCGLGRRLRLLTTGTVADLLCGDVGLLPCRTAGDPYDALALVRSGIPVVTFPVWGWDDPAVLTVPHLDLVAAADAIATALTWDRGKLRAEAEERIEDLATWVDRFLDAVAGCRD